MAVTTASGTGGCQVSLKAYRNLVRDLLEDWEYEDTLDGTITDSQTTLTVANDGSQFGPGDLLEIESEKLWVESRSGDTLTVRRGHRGTTAAQHSDGQMILRSTAWKDSQLNDWINEAFGVIYPSMYVRATTTLTGSSTSYDYDLPAACSEAQFVERIEAQYGSYPIRLTFNAQNVEFRGDDDPVQLYIPMALSGYTLTVQYATPFPTLDDDNDRTTLPERAKMLPVYYAASQATTQKEAPRDRSDVYAVTQNERVVRESQHLQTGREFRNNFYEILRRVKMPRKHSFIGKR